MSGFTTLAPPKSLHQLTPAARALLMDIAQAAKTLPRLTGAPLELVGRQLAIYNPERNGYALVITARGAAMLPKAQGHGRRTLSS